MKLKIFYNVALFYLFVEIIMTRHTDAVCTNVSGSVQSSGVFSNPDYVWSPAIHNLSFHFQFSVTFPCAANNSNMVTDPTLLELFVSDRSNSTIARLRLHSNSCVTDEIFPLSPAYFDSVDVRCNKEASSSNIDMTVTLMNPSTLLNGTQIALRVALTNESSIQTRPIVFKTCPTSLSQSPLKFSNASPLPAGNFEDQVTLHCPHGLVFTKQPGMDEKPRLTTTATCGPTATWVYDQSRCWHGRYVVINANRGVPRPDAPLAKSKPVVFMCRNGDVTNTATIQLKVGDKEGKVDGEISWLNISLHDFPNTQQHVKVQCFRFAENGTELGSNDLQLQLAHKKIHRSKHAPLRHTVYVGSPADVRLPLNVKTPLKRNHVHIKKEGASKPFTLFRIGFTADNHQQYIELLFPKVTQHDLGTYELRISTDRSDLYISTFVLESGSQSLSTGAKVGVALTVVFSCVIIVAIIGCMVRKYMKHRRDSSDDGRVLIVEDNDDNDDVFHDPSRSARIQEELLREPELPETSANVETANKVQLIPKPEADKVSVVSEHSECFVLDDSKNNVADTQNTEE